MLESLRNNPKVYNALIYIGLVFIVGGIALIFNDSMCGGWCSSSMKRSSFRLRDYLNGPAILIIGLLTIAYPAYTEFRKWKQEN